MQPRPLTGKVAIVTGAGSPIGLGRAMTSALVQAGARVAMLDVNKEWLEEPVLGSFFDIFDLYRPCITKK